MESLLGNNRLRLERLLWQRTVTSEKIEDAKGTRRVKVSGRLVALGELTETQLGALASARAVSIPGARS